MPVRVEIAAPLLNWAFERSGRPRDELTERFPKFEEWTSGEVQPTLKQLEAFARFIYTPVGMLFLSEPPVEELPVPDFRTRGRRGTVRATEPESSGHHLYLSGAAGVVPRVRTA